jgi:hypothetical protein
VRYTIVERGSHSPHRESFERFSMALGPFVRQFAQRPGR